MKCNVYYAYDSTEIIGLGPYVDESKQFAASCGTEDLNDIDIGDLPIHVIEGFCQKSPRGDAAVDLLARRLMHAEGPLSRPLGHVIKEWNERP